MQITGNLSSLHLEDISLIERLKPDRCSVFTRFTSGRSGALVLVLDVHGKRDGPQGPHVVKIQDVHIGREERSRHNRARQTRLSQHIPALVDSASDGARVATLYEVAGGHLLNVQPLTYLVQSDVARAIEYVGKAVSLLDQWNPTDHLLRERYSSHAFEMLQQTVNLGKDRLGGKNPLRSRLTQIVPDISRSASILFEGTQVSLPNPVAYVYQEELWEGAQVIWPEGYVHADLHSDNLICDLRNSNLLFIDWASFEENGLALFDWAYLEIDLLLRYLPCTNLEGWTEWLNLTEYMSNGLNPRGEPRGRLAPMAWRLIKPIREAVQSRASQAPKELTEWYEVAFWLASVAASLNFSRKKGISAPNKTAVLLYGARSLERTLYELQISRRSAPPVYVPFPRYELAIDWEEVGLASQDDSTEDTKLIDVFLSYAHQDIDHVMRLSRDLQDRGFSVWYDTAELKGGEAWIESITRGINRAPIFISLISDASNQSTWVQREFLYAESKGKQVIPIQVGPCDLPIYMLDRQAIELHTNYAEGFRQLMTVMPKPFAKTHFVSKVGQVNRRLLEQAYLDRLLFKYEVWRELYTPMAGIAETSGNGSRHLQLPVTPSTMNPMFELIKTRIRELEEPRQPSSYKVTNIALEIQSRRVVLLGDPGSGKSTTLWNLVSTLAQAAQQNANLPLPILVPLGSYTGGESVLEYIQSNSETLLGELASFLPELLQEKKVAILLDGLNEMPRSDYEERISRLKDFLENHPDLLAVVTCRELDYTYDLGLDEIRIAPLDPMRIKAFLKSYLKDEGEVLFWKLIDSRAQSEYWPRFQQGGGNEYDFWLADEEPQGLTEPWFYWDWHYWLRLRDNPRSYLGIAHNPYMLYMIAQIYARHRDLPANRGQLFRLFVDVLMAREKHKVSEEDWIDEKEQRDALSRLAYAMQEGGTQGTSVEKESAIAHLGSPQMLYIAASENILQIGERIRFAHQLLQEFFAAYALDQERLKGKLASDFWPPSQWWKPVGWEETSVLLAGLYHDNPLSVLNWLRDTNPELAARCLVDGGIPIRDAIRQMLVAAWLPRLTDLKEPVLARAALGRALGLIDADARPGVCLIDDNGLPVIEWCEVPGGPFVMGEREGFSSETLEYRISKYLITNSQYQAFIDNRGYSDTWRHCWTEAGWKEKGDALGPEDYSETLTLPNHPRIGLSWYEAVAFCRWLDYRMRELSLLPEGTQIRLPTEKEWEKAARGTNGRIYPWGNEFDANKCNVIGIESTTAVGIFPDGASPYGVMDMVGNVWKWCLTKWDEDPTAQEDNRLEGTDKRVYRGGSWGSDVWRTDQWNPEELHCGRRYWIVPEDDRPDAIGFFIVLAPSN